MSNSLRQFMGGPVGRAILLAVGALAIVVMVVVGARFLRPADDVPPPPARFEVSADVLRSGAGKVGDLIVAEEAIELAGIAVAPATTRVEAEELAVSGVIEAGGDQKVRVTPRVAGTLGSVSVAVGDSVRAGQTLAVIKSVDLARAQAEHRQASARVAVTREALARKRELAELGAFARPPVEGARSDSAIAEDETTSAEREVTAAMAAVAKARSENAALESDVAGAKSEVAAAGSEAAAAESQVTRAEGLVTTRQAEMSQAETQVEVDQSRLSRMDVLLKEQLVSQQEWEQAGADVRQAQANVDAAQANIRQAEAELQSAKSLWQAAEATIDAAEAKARALEERVKLATAGIETAEKHRVQAEARLGAVSRRQEIAGEVLDREEAVYEGGYAATKEIVEAEGALREAEIERDATAESVRLLGGSPGGGSTIAIAAPIGGRVQERNASPGETVDTEHALFVLLNLDVVWAQLSVSPKDMLLVREGQFAEFSAETAPERGFGGVVSAVSATADPDTRAIQVRCTLDNADAALRPGAFVQGTIETDVARKRVTVPDGALQEHFGQHTVYVSHVVPGSFEVRHVTLGVAGDGWREITAGLDAGEPIAVSGTFYLKSEALKSALSDGCCAPPGAG